MLVDFHLKLLVLSKCRIECITLFSSSADVNAKDNFKWSPLHHACHSGQVDLVQLLLESGAEIDAQTINGGTPLMRAIESSREPLVEFLISKGFVRGNRQFNFFYLSEWRRGSVVVCVFGLKSKRLSPQDVDLLPRCFLGHETSLLVSLHPCLDRKSVV